jgi:hypothetical protein
VPSLVDERVVRAARGLDDALRNKVSSKHLAQKAAAHCDAVIKHVTAWPVYYHYEIDPRQPESSWFIPFPRYTIDLSPPAWAIRNPHCDVFIPINADWTKYPYLSEEPQRYSPDWLKRKGGPTTHISTSMRALTMARRRVLPTMGHCPSGSAEQQTRSV